MIGGRRAYSVAGERWIDFQKAALCVFAALLFPALFGPSAFAQTGKPAVAPPSKWVVPVAINNQFNLDTPDPSVGLRWVLVEKQINAGSDERFFRWVGQILTPAGVIKGSHIAMPYDPTYESLTMHWVRIRRGTNILNQLDSSRIQTAQPGPGGPDFLFTSEKLATLLLDGVRPGDLIDYAYSIDGSNPALNGMFTDRVPVQYPDPVEHLFTRLLWPSARKLYVQNHDTQIYPATASRSNMVEFTWDAAKVPGVRLEPPIPIWYNPYPWVQLSEYQKWSEVNEWALKMFATNNAPSPEFARQIDEWNQLPSQEERARAALNFMQEHVGNVGPENPAPAYLPATPSMIFGRRFGDSKDKSWLLVTMLRALGIDAFPVLVNTQARQTIAQLHPSPVIFDHVIVEATVDNLSYYLDSTATFEKGPLPVRSWPDYGFGLPVRPGTTALTVIPPCPVQPKTTVSEYFDIGGFEMETGVNIVTAAEGADADALRERFATTPFEQIEREYLAVQAEYYPEIHATAPLQFSDDEQNNRFQVTGSYSIPRFWKRRADDSYFHCNFYSFNVDEAIHKPEDSTRAMPLGINHPVHQVFHAQASWLVGWPVRPDTQNIQNPAFSFGRSMNIVGTNLLMDFEYRSTSDWVAPEALPTYIEQVDAARKFLDCSVVSY
jgi:hypothetical protein